ncbi:MAG TPA: hypothetical protein EYM97_02800 [Gemmatimonadetes bacterium]|nr:hypothetical protein [Gemmatimonadota bacterium]
MTSLYLVIGFFGILAVSIYLAVTFAGKASEAERDAEQAMSALSARERFNERMRRPLSTGTDLVRDLRARLGLSSHGDGESSRMSGAHGAVDRGSDDDDRQG